MFTITTAAQGCAAEKHNKEYKSEKTALLAGKRLLTNQEGGAVIVYSGGGAEVVASATKQGWVWRDND